MCLPLNILRLVLGSSLKFHFARPGCGRLRPALAGATMRHQLAGVVTQAFRSCIASAIPGCFWSRVKARMSESGQMTRANHHQHWTPGARVCSYKLLRAWTPCLMTLPNPRLSRSSASAKSYKFLSCFVFSTAAVKPSVWAGTRNQLQDRRGLGFGGVWVLGLGGWHLAGAAGGGVGIIVYYCRRALEGTKNFERSIETYEEDWSCLRA